MKEFLRDYHWHVLAGVWLLAFLIGGIGTLIDKRDRRLHPERFAPVAEKPPVTWRETIREYAWMLGWGLGILLLLKVLDWHWW